MFTELHFVDDDRRNDSVLDATRMMLTIMAIMMKPLAVHVMAGQSVQFALRWKLLSRI